MNVKDRKSGDGGDEMPKEQARDWMCYWQSDASPVPVIRVKKTITHKGAKAWLKKQEASEHWTPKIVKSPKEPLIPAPKKRGDCGCMK